MKSSEIFVSVYVNQELWKLVGCRQSYCNNKKVYFLDHCV